MGAQQLRINKNTWNTMLFILWDITQCSKNVSLTLKRLDPRLATSEARREESLKRKFPALCFRGGRKGKKMTKTVKSSNHKTSASCYSLRIWDAAFSMLRIQDAALLWDRSLVYASGSQTFSGHCHLVPQTHPQRLTTHKKHHSV